MTGDKPTLTRRRVLGGVATVGAAGAVGASSWAAFSDTETVRGDFTAGSLDLVVNVLNDSSDFTVFDLGNVAPGDGGQKKLNVRNNGSITGVLKADVSRLVSNENSITEPESTTDSDSEGELDNYLEFRFTYGSGPGNTGWLTANELASKPPLPLDTEFKGGDKDTILVEWRVNKAAGNEIQTDSVRIEVTFTLDQK